MGAVDGTHVHALVIAKFSAAFRVERIMPYKIY